MLVCDSSASSLLLFHSVSMYRVWNVTFRVKTDSRGPCDPLYRTEPLARGSVGDADPFSDAFGRFLTGVEDSLQLRSTRYQPASSATSDTSDIFSLQSPAQDSPFTPTTAHSTFSRSDGRGSITKQLRHEPIPKLDYYTGNIEARMHAPKSTEEQNFSRHTISELPSKLEDQNDPDLGPGRSGTTNHMLAYKSQTESPSDTNIKQAVQRKRKKKAPFTMAPRHPAKTREQHLFDNKAAAAKCRQHRKVWETHLQDTSSILKASIDASKTEISKLGGELAALQRQIWECPTCAERYVQSRGLQSTRTASWLDFDDNQPA
jgi:hypothetical protein